MGYRIKGGLKSDHLIDNRNHIGWYSVAVIATERMCNGFQVKTLEDAVVVVGEIADIRKSQGLTTSKAIARQIVSKDRKGKVGYGEVVEIEVKS